MPIQQMMLGAGGAAPVKVQDVFSVDLWNGNGSSQSITNDINLSGEGGMVMIKNRDETRDMQQWDTVRGNTEYLRSSQAHSHASGTSSSMLTSFNSDGYSLGSDNHVNENGDEHIGWTFRKHPKFFDIQTATLGADDSTYDTSITHQLDCDVGMAVFKSRNMLSQGYTWVTWLKGICVTTNQYLRWNQNVGRQSGGNSISYNASTKTFSFGYPASQAADRMRPGTGGASNVVAYFFADNNGAGEFGSGGDEDIIKCGTYNGTGNVNTAPAVNVGFEPQFLMVKRAFGNSYWTMWDSTRGVNPGTTTEDYSWVNYNAKESNWPQNMMEFTSTGFQTRTNFSEVNSSGEYFYMAIRKDQS